MLARWTALGVLISWRVTLDLAPAVVVQVLDAQATALRNPPRRLEDLLATLENNGLAKSMAEVQRLRGQGR